MSDNLEKWMERYDFLPEWMRDFHDQKDLFRSIEIFYGNNGNATGSGISWVDAHVYTIDRFLWYMASRGYTLQKCRKNVQFRDMLDHHKIVRDSMPPLSVGTSICQTTTPPNPPTDDD